MQAGCTGLQAAGCIGLQAGCTGSIAGKRRLGLFVSSGPVTPRLGT